MTQGRKPVLVRKLSQEWILGYAESEPRPQEEGLEVLDAHGKLLRVNWEQIKWLCYLRDLESSASDPANPERLLQKNFRSRPRSAGLWLRLTLADHDRIEGLAANDLSLIKNEGLLLMPPDTRSNTQRIFIPHHAIAELEVLGLIKAGAKKRHADVLEQPNLFSSEPEG